MGKLILITVSLLISSVAYGTQLICEKKEFEDYNFKIEYSFVISDKNLKEGLGVRTHLEYQKVKGRSRTDLPMVAVDNTFFFERSDKGREGGIPFLYIYTVIYDNAERDVFYFHPKSMRGGRVGGIKNLKCRYA